jgi:hypothetical protein
VDVPGLGGVPLVDGRPIAVEQIRVQVPGPETRFDDKDRGYLRVDSELAEIFVSKLHAPVVAFGSRNRVVNTNTAMLAGLRDYNVVVPMAQLLASNGPTAKNFADHLTNPLYGIPQIVVTTSTSALDFEPRVNQATVERAVRSLGMRRVQVIQLPDGRQMRVWTAIP